LQTAIPRHWAISLQIFPALVLAVFLGGFESEADLSSISQEKIEQRIPELEKLLSEGRDPGQQWRTELLLGKSYLEMKDYVKAQKMLESPDLETSPLKEYSEYFLIQARRGSDPRYTGEDLWQKLYSSGGEASFKLEAADKLGDYYFNLRDYEKALPYFEALLPAFPENAGLRYKIARSYEATSRRPLAAPHAKWLYVEAPAAKETLDLFEECPYLLSELQRTLDKNDISRRLTRLEEQGASQILEKEYPLYENLLDKDEAAFFKASILASRNKNLEAVNLLLSIGQESGLYVKSLDRCVQNIKGTGGKALEVEKKLIAVSDPEKEKILFKLFSYYKKGSIESDAERTAKALLPFSNAEAAGFLYKKAWQTYLDGARQKAVDIFSCMARLLPPDSDDHQAALFSLLQLKALGEKEADSAKGELLSYSRYGYYGYRLRGGLPPKQTETAASLPPILTPPEPQSRRFKAELLAETGLGTEAVEELEDLLKTSQKQELYWELALISSKAQIYPKSIRAARKLYPSAFTAEGDKLPRQAWELVYPLPYFDSFKKTAKEKGLPVATLYSIARQESLFDRNAVSKAGARGMIQLMPSTARMIAAKNGVEITSEDSLNDVEINLNLGSTYFLSIYNKFDSSLPLALAGYNAGPGRPMEWKQRPNNPQQETLFIESIPFKETRTYIKRIMNNIWEYQRLYPELKTQ
jgi:soluble lytic murein transglycosylase-like protein